MYKINYWGVFLLFLGGLVLHLERLYVFERDGPSLYNWIVFMAAGWAWGHFMGKRIVKENK